jgi:hypothetical protein
LNIRSQQFVQKEISFLDFEFSAPKNEIRFESQLDGGNRSSASMVGLRSPASHYPGGFQAKRFGKQKLQLPDLIARHAESCQVVTLYI